MHRFFEEFGPLCVVHAAPLHTVAPSATPRSYIIRAMFAARAEKDYRHFWLSQFVSNIGTWMHSVAQGWLVLRLTDSPCLLGFVGFANSIPILFLMLPAGVLADQLDRRRVLRSAQSLQ